MFGRGLVCFQQWSRCHGEDWIELLSSETEMQKGKALDRLTVMACTETYS